MKKQCKRTTQIINAKKIKTLIHEMLNQSILIVRTSLRTNPRIEVPVSPAQHWLFPISHLESQIDIKLQCSSLVLLMI
jgi:hypothetical protein